MVPLDHLEAWTERHKQSWTIPAVENNPSFPPLLALAQPFFGGLRLVVDTAFVM